MKILKSFLMLGISLPISLSFANSYKDHNEEQLNANKTYITPTKILSNSQWPEISDDLFFEGMDTAIERQLVKFRKRSHTNYIRLGGINYSTAAVPASLLAFQHQMRKARLCIHNAVVENELKECYSTLQSDLQNSFHMMVPNNYGSAKALFTGYFTPTLKAKRFRTGEYYFGIYKKPKSASLNQLTRAQIDYQNRLVNSGYDLWYSPNPFDLYILHIQGGGRLAIEEEDGSISYQYITFDGTNQKSLNWISRYMLKQGYIDNPSTKAQRDFLNANPNKWEEVFSTDPHYVYFKPSIKPPEGNEGVSLTNGRSIATDRKLYTYKGLVAFISSQRPTEDSSYDRFKWRSFKRFFIDHDTGGAIKGEARADIFFGEDAYAQMASELMKTKGDIHFLVLKPHLVKYWKDKI